VETRPLTQAVETVEKVNFQKLFLKIGTDTLKSAWFWFFHTIVWQFFSLLWEIFINIFRTRSFSIVSLGADSDDIQLARDRSGSIIIVQAHNWDLMVKMQSLMVWSSTSFCPVPE
jgi:hypothetical protein